MLNSLELVRAFRWLFAPSPASSASANSPPTFATLDPGNFVTDYIALGDKDQAFAWLEKAYAEHSNYMSSLKVWVLYDPLRSDPRFGDLERRVKLLR